MRLGSFSKPKIDWQACLALSRVSVIPTIWSDCLAAWILSEGGISSRVVVLAFGASLFYMGAAWLNDYADIEFDRDRQLNRPLVAGRIPSELARDFGIFWLVLGGGLMVLGGGALVAVIALTGLVLLYNRVHKATSLGQVLQGACRLLLYIAVASATSAGVSGFVLWCGIALGIYAGTAGYIGRKGIPRDLVKRWPVLLLGAPVLLALIANRDEYMHRAVWLSFVLALWVLPCLRHSLRTEVSNRRLTLSGLTAGIVLVDLLATGGESPEIIAVFGALFILSIVLQRYLPEG